MKTVFESQLVNHN